MSALDDAIAAHMTHPAMGCDDRGTEALIAQCTQPQPLDYLEGQHPAQLEADAALLLPRWWPLGCAAVLAITWLCSYVWPWGFAR